MTLAIGRWLRDRARATPHRTAIVFGDDLGEHDPEHRQDHDRGGSGALGRHPPPGRDGEALDIEISYAELNDRSERLAAGLAAAGLRPGDRIATLTRNRPEHVELFFACAKAGLILTPINVRLTAAEIAYQLSDAEPALLFAAPEFRSRARESAEATGTGIAELTRAGLDAFRGDGRPAVIAQAGAAPLDAAATPQAASTGSAGPRGDAGVGRRDASAGHAGVGGRTVSTGPVSGQAGAGVHDISAAHAGVPERDATTGNATGDAAKTWQAAASGAWAGGVRAAVVGDEPADDAGLLLVYTSGTTGRPKGALLTHANCFWTNLSLDRGCELREDDVVLQVLPQFHVGGWNVQPLLAWWKGATVVLEPAFDAGRALGLIERHRVTTMMGVPATYLFMARHPGFATADLSSLRRVVVGGAPMPEPLLRTWLDRGVPIVQGYGLTEAAPNVLCLPAEYVAGRIGWAGMPYPHVDVALRDPETGAGIDGPGQGELVVRGPNVFAGYWRNSAATLAAVPDGWLRTGDVAERDAEGFYRIRDRVKDMYVSGGENVYPAEVESALQAHPAVAEVAVVGVPDPRWGEVGCAFVVPARRPPAADLPDELVAHCRARLAGFKVPRHVRLVDRLPRSALDKVLKTELRGRWGEA